jgi:two-component system, NarL family, nitrate/nitrite response regulator NarL
MRCISVVIADRHPVVLQGLANVLRSESGFKVVASCSDGPTCIEAIRSLVPDIAILDVSLPGLTGLEILTIANSAGLPRGWSFSPHLLKTANWLYRPRPVPMVSF